MPPLQRVRRAEPRSIYQLTVYERRRRAEEDALLHRAPKSQVLCQSRQLIPDKAAIQRHVQAPSCVYAGPAQLLRDSTFCYLAALSPQAN